MSVAQEKLLMVMQFNPDLGFRLELYDLSEKKESNWDTHSTQSYQWCKQSGSTMLLRKKTIQF